MHRPVVNISLVCFCTPNSRACPGSEIFPALGDRSAFWRYYFSSLADTLGLLLLIMYLRTSYPSSAKTSWEALSRLGESASLPAVQLPHTVIGLAIRWDSACSREWHPEKHMCLVPSPGERRGPVSGLAKDCC